MSSEKYYSQSQDSQPLARQHDKNLVLVHEVYANGDRYDGFAAPTLDLQQRPSGTISPRMVKEGQGTYVFANGSSYVGEWSRGQMNGWGTFTDGGNVWIVLKARGEAGSVAGVSTTTTTATAICTKEPLMPSPAR